MEDFNSKSNTFPYSQHSHSSNNATADVASHMPDSAGSNGGGGGGGAKYKLMSPAKLPISRSTTGITIPPGLSPTSFLESPVLLSNIKKFVLAGEEDYAAGRKMIVVSLSSSILCPKQLSCVISKAVWPASSCKLSYTKTKRCFDEGVHFRVRLANGCSRRRVSNYEGLWEDPDDGSGDSEYEDDEEDEEMEEEEDDLDYESDWEDNGSAKAVVSSAEESSLRKYEENLVREVEQLLGPEERAILAQHEAPDLEKLSTAKWKPLHTFALAGQIKFMDALLEKGYDIDLVDKDGLTALHLAVIGKREAVISHLLRKGANPEVKDLDGATPLHYAAQVGAMQTVKLLIKYKVDVNVADNEGWTPLHVALQTRNRDIAKILLVNGADRTRRNKDGNTPLDLSLCYGKDFKSYDLAKLLKQVPASRGF